jgi:hypothetical protein
MDVEPRRERPEAELQLERACDSRRSASPAAANVGAAASAAATISALSSSARRRAAIRPRHVLHCGVSLLCRRATRRRRPSCCRRKISGATLWFAADRSFCKPNREMARITARDFFVMLTTLQSQSHASSASLITKKQHGPFSGDWALLPWRQHARAQPRLPFVAKQYACAAHQCGARRRSTATRLRLRLCNDTV